jgi:hypothetical protein
LELRTGLRNQKNTCPDMPCTQDCGSGASGANISSSYKPGIV